MGQDFPNQRVSALAEKLLVSHYGKDRILPGFTASIRGAFDLAIEFEKTRIKYEDDPNWQGHFNR